MYIVRLENAVKIYEDESAVPINAITGISLNIEPGEFTVIAGPSGSGKTTLLNLIGGLDMPTSGKVFVADKDISELTGNQLAEFRLHNIGFVFQSYNLIPVLTVEENVEFIILLQGAGKEERHRRVTRELQDLDIGEDLLKKRPNRLSGGQQQRVAVARATVARPKLILADEPTANLDSKTGSRLLDNMKEMNEKKGITFIFSSHDPMVIERGRRLISLRDGMVVEDSRRL